MATLYLVDKPLGEVALSLAALDREACIVLLQDGVYLDPRRIVEAGRAVYALRPDAEKRGIASRLPPSVRLIGYPELVELIFQHRVLNFI